MWLDDVVTLLIDAGAAHALGEDVWTSSMATVPLVASGGQATILITETSAGGPERVQNQTIKPAYLHVGAQIVCRHKSYAVAKAKAQACYDSVVGVRNAIVTNFVTSGWYREINPMQEPFDMGVDARGQARCGFNIHGIRANKV